LSIRGTSKNFKNKKQEKRAFKKQLRKQIKAMKKSYKNNPDNKSKKGQKFLAVFGTVILLVVLVTGFAILACYLFCVGSFAFALIAVFGGIGDRL